MVKMNWYDVWHQEGKIKIPENYKTYLEAMLLDLQQGGLEITLIPSKNIERYRASGCMVRNGENTNPPWYRELCLMHPKPEYKKNRSNGKLKKRPYRKNSQTNLKKGDIINVINSLINEKTSKSKHAPYLLGVAEKYMESSEILKREIEEEYFLFGPEQQNKLQDEISF